MPQQVPDNQDQFSLSSDYSDYSGSDSDDFSDALSSSVRPEDSISNAPFALPRNLAGNQQNVPPVNPLANYSGLENSLHTGFAQALPKHARGIQPSNASDLAWFHMRGYSTASEKMPKADQINKNYTTINAPSFRAPSLPDNLPIPRNHREYDNRLRSNMNSYGAPAHLVSQLFSESEPTVTVPLAQALAHPTAITDQSIRESLQAALTFMQTKASLLMGFTLRSLGASYNGIAQCRRDNIVKIQSADLQRALEQVRPGYNSFFDTNIDPLVARAQGAQQLRLTQQALYNQNSNSSHHNSNRRDSHHRQDNSHRRRQGNRRGRRNDRDSNNRTPRKRDDKKPPPRRDGRGGRRGGGNGGGGNGGGGSGGRGGRKGGGNNSKR